MSQQVLCRECRHNGGQEKECTSLDALYTDYVNGLKIRVIINLDGNCSYFGSIEKEGED